MVLQSTTNLDVCVDSGVVDEVMRSLVIRTFHHALPVVHLIAKRIEGFSWINYFGRINVIKRVQGRCEIMSNRSGQVDRCFLFHTRASRCHATTLFTPLSPLLSLCLGMYVRDLTLPLLVVKRIKEIGLGRQTLSISCMSAPLVWTSQMVGLHRVVAYYCRTTAYIE